MINTINYIGYQPSKHPHMSYKRELLGQQLHIFLRQIHYPNIFVNDRNKASLNANDDRVADLFSH